MFAMMAVQPQRTHGVDVGAEFRDVIYEHRHPLKRAALTMGYRDSSHLSRALDGLPSYAIDLWRVLELDGDVLEHLFARLLWKKRGAKLMARAELPVTRNDERKVG